ncbi:MAG: TetR/AcrR family transcriptional regulator [Clostridia bacterium]|nr:TetR/AcrR family transcriptional regulator [Clostridia bacterium]
MQEKTEVKERIIAATTELIEQSEGDVECITARAIAERANVCLGLINYHFGCKENLITVCVQRIICHVVAGMEMAQDCGSDRQRLTIWATHVFDFLFEHSAISRLSILGDLRNYTEDCNSVRTQRGFVRSMTEDVDEADRPFAAFVLTAAMQAAFLGRDAAQAVLGYDFARPEDRRAYIERLVNGLFDGCGRRADGCE